MSQKHPEMVALNADVVGYSRLIADDLETTTATMDVFHELVGRRIEENAGQLVNFVGDNFMAVFDGAIEAMRAAVAITTDVESMNARVPDSSKMRFRIGMDVGPVTASADDYFGDALNIAARIQAIAPPGGISVSGRVYRALDEPALRFRPIGRQRLKNIPEEVDVYEFADLPGDGSAPSAPTGLRLESPIVAVLPIHADSVEGTVRATAEMLRTDLIHRLTRMPQLRVIDAKTGLSGDGATEGARYVIETGVHQFGDDVRIYSNVFDVTSMNIVKSHKWNAKAADLFGLSDEFADEVARALEVDVIVGEPAGLYADLDDPVAIEQVYLGWYHLTAGTPEDWAKSLSYFDKVARTHPDKPYGHALLAFSNWMGASSGWARDREEVLGRAREQARVALAAGDQTGMAKTVEAAVLMSQGHGEQALQMREEVEIQRPTCDATYGVEGSVRRYLGQWEQAVELTDTAMRLTGVNKPWYPTVKACSLLMGGRVEQAATTAEMVLEHQPRNLEALLVLTAAQVELGSDRRARATADLVRERFPAVDVEAWLEASPYQDQASVERWRKDLTAAGLMSAE